MMMETKVQRELRVLMVTPRYFPYMGGIETHVHEVGRRLATLGVRVTLLTTMPHAPQLSHASLPREEERDGMHVIRVPAWPPERDYYIAPEIFSVVKRGEWDIVHCQGCHTLVPPLAMLAAKRAALPYVVTFHTGGHSSSWRTRIRDTQWHVLRSLFAGAAELIGVSHFEADYFQRTLHLPASRFTVIANGVTPPSTRFLTAPIHPLIISIGRLEQYKGHHHLITALPLIREQRPDMKLLILGSGPYEAALRALAHRVGVAEHVTIRSIPAGERDTMAATLAQAALVTLFSAYEAHPIAVLEALALARPVLVADTSGLRELAQQGLVRAIPLTSTPREIATAALQQIEHPLIPEHIALPTWDECADAVLSVYETSVGGNVCVS